MNRSDNMEFENIDIEMDLQKTFEDESKVRSWNTRAISSLSTDITEYKEQSAQDIYQRPAYLSEACSQGRYRAEHGGCMDLQFDNAMNRYTRLMKMIEQENQGREVEYILIREPVQEQAGNRKPKVTDMLGKIFHSRRN